MFIRETKTGTVADGSPRVTFRLVESRRVDGKVRQQTLLNLGRYFAVDRADWPLLCWRVDELMSNQMTLEPGQPDPVIEAEARRIAARLLERRSGEPSDGDWETVDIGSAADSDGRSVGVEHAAMEAFSLLGLPQLLGELGFGRRQVCCALACIAARMAVPGSERATHKWLCRGSAMGELLGVDFAALSVMALHRASDRLLAHRDIIEERLFARTQSLFDFTPTVALYDLTNTYYEGEAGARPKARRGHLREKRTDCPLLTLGLVLDDSGFVRRSRVFAGNVVECRTLGEILDSLGGDRNAVVVMDRGIADEASLAWLRENGYRYLVMSRERTRVFDAEETLSIATASSDGIEVYKETVGREEADGTPYREASLHCRSAARADRERRIMDQSIERFELELRKLRDGLAGPRTRKGLADIQRRIGRLQKGHSRVARHYDVRVTPDEAGERAVGVEWTFRPDGTAMTHPGVYCMRGNILDWDGERMWRTHAALTDAGAVFRSLKSELGLRPIFHQKQERSDGHLFISVLACQAIQVLRRRMKEAGRHECWATVRQTLCSLQRTTTSFRRREGGVLHVPGRPGSTRNRLRSTGPWASGRRPGTSARPSTSLPPSKFAVDVVCSATAIFRASKTNDLLH